MANIITFIRIIGTFPLIFMLLDKGIILYCFILFVFLGLTDFFDGYLARK